VLKDAVHSKPKDLLEHVAQALQDRSGMDPVDFEHFFEECKRKPRTYVLEDRCPVGQDPFSWVPMRYNDDTILRTLQLRGSELITEILAALPITDTKGFLNKVCVAYPELSYVREKPSELVEQQMSFAPSELAAFQAMRAVYLGCSGVSAPECEDEFIEFGFLCEALVQDAREKILKPEVTETMMDTLFVFLILRVLGAHEGFRKRYGGDNVEPEAVILHAIENEVSVLPSFARLQPDQKALITAALQVYFPLDMLITAEVVPTHFLKAKELLTPLEGGMMFYICAVVLDHVFRCRTRLVPSEAVDLARLGCECLTDVSKHSAPRCYELFIKKRGERHSWRVVREDLSLKAIVRMCCFAGCEDTDAWSLMLSTVDALPDHEKEVLKTELARKDGFFESPVYVLEGAGKFMEAATTNNNLTAKPALLLLARILEDAARSFDRLATLNQRTVSLNLDQLAPLARDWSPSGAKFEDTHFEFESLGTSTVLVKLSGAA